MLLGIKGGCGTVFELSPPQTKGGQWTYITLYSFKGGKDGYYPPAIWYSTGRGTYMERLTLAAAKVQPATPTIDIAGQYSS